MPFPALLAALAANPALLSQGLSFLTGNTGGSGGPTSGGAAPSTPFGLGAGIAPLVQGIRSLVQGPGRGAMRRADARSAASQSPGLMRIQAAVRQSGATTAAQIADAVAGVVGRDPEANAALQAVLTRAQQLGGFTSLQGVEANTLGDVLKFTFGLGTVRTKGAPAAGDVVTALTTPGRVGAPVPGPTPTPVTVPSTFAASPNTGVGQLVALRNFLAGPDAAPANFTGDTMGTFTDAIQAGLSVAQSFLPPPSSSPPFILPGGAPAATAAGAGGLMLAGMSNFLPSVGLPFIDLAPSGGAAVFEPYRQTPSGARAQVHVQVNPATGKMDFFGPLGRPVWFSRDTAVCRRGRRLASKLGGVTGANRGMRRRRGGR